MKTDFVNGFACQTDISFSEFKGINLRLRFTGKKACAKATAARTIRSLSTFESSPHVGAFLCCQGETRIDVSGSIPTPNAMDTTINPIETMAAHMMNLRSNASGRCFARSRIEEVSLSSTAPS